MDLPAVELQSGTLKDILGPMRDYEGLRFVPAEVEYSGYEAGPCLIEFAATAESATRALVRPGEDAPWVSGRIQFVFRQNQIPESERAEKCCMWFSFMAVVMDGERAIGVPFVCTDNYGRSLLLFSDDPCPDSNTMQKIAAAFWSLLLQEPEQLVDYRDRMEHVGAGVTIEFGVDDGEPFMRERHR